MRRLFLALIIGVLAGMFSGAPAVAHSALEDSSPQPGASVGSGVERISLRFAGLGSEDITLALREEKRGQQRLGAPVVRGEATVCAATEQLTPGTYTLSYRVISSDGDEVESAFIFRVTDTAAPVEPLTACASGALPSPTLPQGGGDKENSTTPAWKMWLVILAVPLGVVMAVMAGKILKWYARRARS